MMPFFTYFGGKFRVAPQYPMALFDTIVEPFAGAAGYSLRHHRRRVILVDSDPIIVGLWQYLIGVSSDEVRGLPLVIGDEETVDDFDICQEAKWLIGFWLNKGTVRPCRSPSAWARSQMRPNSYWGLEIRNRIANQVEGIRHWEAIHGTYDEAPDVKATWFIDPPYHRSGKHYSHHEVDYDYLGRWCQGRDGQVIVCEQAGATWLPFSTFKTIKTSRVGGGRTSDEVIWTSGDEPPEQMDLF